MASPFPPHVCEFLFPSGCNLLDKNGVYIQPLTSSRSLKTVLKEIEGQRRRSLISAGPIERPSEQPILPILQPALGNLQSLPTPKELRALQTEAEELREEEGLGKPLVPSQRLLAFLHTHSEAPLRKALGRVRLPPFPFSVPRKGIHRSAVSSRVASPVFFKVGSLSVQQLNEGQSPVTYRAADKHC